jgi:hypothetical protein
MTPNLDLGPRALALIETRAYLRGLPDGLASYPECVGKASIYRRFVDETALGDAATKLPHEIAALITQPRVHSSWVSEVLTTCLYLGVRDLCFPSDDAFVDHFREVNRAVVSSPMYRVMFALVSPLRLIDGGAKRMSALHRGLGVSILETRSHGGRLALSYPPNLLPRLIARCYATAFEVLVEAAGGKEPCAHLVRHEPDAATFDVTWR